MQNTRTINVGIVGLGFMTDSDGTETTVTGWYDDIELRVGK